MEIKDSDILEMNTSISISAVLIGIVGIALVLVSVAFESNNEVIVKLFNNLSDLVLRNAVSILLIGLGIVFISVAVAYVLLDILLG